VAREVPRLLVRRARGDGDVHVGRADRGHDRHRRVARHRDGGGGPLSARPLAEEIQEVAAIYPDSKSAILPGLRLAQERHGGWLPPEALVEVADALDLTPAYCKAVASFYDMFHLEPVGRHLVEICTNLSCALVGAQRVVEAFAAELGVAPGETTADGEVTLRAVECLGGCGYAPVVSVDNRYREPVREDQVAAIVEELRGGS
jgi:NADH-quinone oxidoreductase subunit E